MSSRRDGFGDVVVSLEPYQAIAVVTGSKALMLLPFVLKYTLVKIACYSDVQRVTPAGHNVSEIRALVHSMHATPARADAR